MDLILKNICKAYDEKTVLEQFSAVFAPGKTYAIMGPSGKGKTTLLRLILGLEKPDAGEITGVPRRIAAVFQESRLCPELTAGQNIALVLPPRQEAAITRMLEALDLQDCGKTKAADLSEGQQRRVALARALLYGGDLLVLDEPFTGLDEETKSRALAAIRTARGNATVLLVTHNREDAAALGAEIVNL